MRDIATDMESDIESDLIDLGTIPLRALRELDGPVIERALQQVMQGTANPRVSRGSSERID